MKMKLPENCPPWLDVTIAVIVFILVVGASITAVVFLIGLGFALVVLPFVIAGWIIRTVANWL